MLEEEIEILAYYKQASELDKTRFSAFRERILNQEYMGAVHTARSYPGYPKIPLDPVQPAHWPALETTLYRRRSHRQLAIDQPTRQVLSHLLKFAHGINDELQRGPTPSSGGLQSLELYCVVLHQGWLMPGIYHYDRVQHVLSQLAQGAARDVWEDVIPSLGQFTGGALLWLLISDGARICGKYGVRGYRFAHLEAGHLMQNLCLLSNAYNFCTLPLGGFYEQTIAKILALHTQDWVLYVGACGKILK